MKIIIFTLIPVIILAILNSKGILPETPYYILVALVAIIGSVYFWYRYGSIIMRDNMNYQEYDWYFDQSAAPKGSADSTDPWLTSKLPGTCIGSACCSDNQVYDEVADLCVTGSATNSTTTETFVNNVLTKTSGKLKPDVNLKPPMPTHSESFINYQAKKY